MEFILSMSNMTGDTSGEELAYYPSWAPAITIKSWLVKVLFSFLCRALHVDLFVFHHLMFFCYGIVNVSQLINLNVPAFGINHLYFYSGSWGKCFTILFFVCDPIKICLPLSLWSMYMYNLVLINATKLKYIFKNNNYLSHSITNLKV